MSYSTKMIEAVASPQELQLVAVLRTGIRIRQTKCFTDMAAIRTGCWTGFNQVTNEI